ncbi:glutathione S-transferase kappa 1 [Marchantia polymorpha subsp. ruderalis]|nr:hypothetical protein MARPO_0006s0236 [Marchantia polymorpha]BBN04785.1 hypothetical protein Mp_3g07600 [Marchantia polymorpha subsp. ruderalis]|eukprot:PTQ48232.1 hypothetical protein MARPO_0006s0236 [Marchantia polymorpha]
MTTPVIIVCVDVASVYSWFCTQVLLRYKERWGVRLQFRPVLLGAIFKGSGNVMPTLLPARGAWIHKDLALNTRFMQIPLLEFPSTFGSPKFNSLLIQRALTAVAIEKGYESEEFANTLVATWKAIWGTRHVQELDMHDPDFVLRCLTSAGYSLQESQTFLQRASEGSVKECLKKNTELALKNGAFGAPSIFVYLNHDAHQKVEDLWQLQAPEHFIFGSDRLDQLAFAVSQKWEGPVPPSLDSNPPISKL